MSLHMRITREQCSRATALLRELCPRYLTIGKLWKEQPKEKRREFCKAACDLEPLFTRYVDQWPIKDYTQTHLATWRSRLKAKRQASAAGDQRPTRPGGSQPEIAGGVMSRETSQHPPSPVVRGTPRTGSSVSSNRRPACISGFRAILKANDPILGMYYENFAAAGIHDMSTLTMFCKLPRLEKECFLIDHCGITAPLHYIHVRVELDRVHDKYTMTDGSVAAAA